MNKKEKEREHFFNTAFCCKRCNYKYECEEGIDFIYDCPLEEELDFEDDEEGD